MDRIDNVDLREALGDIARNNTFFHLDNDLGISIEQMERAAKLNDYNDKTLLWVSYPSGIDCYPEREVFQKDSRGYNGVQYHGTDMPGDRKLVYAVDVTGIKDGRVFGSLYETDIREYAKNVRENAVSSNSIRIYVDDPQVGGKQIVMPRDEFDRRYPLDLVKMAYWRREPDDPDALKAVLDNMWNSERDGKYKECSLWSHTSKLHDSRDVFYSEQILRDLDKLREPNSADKQFFTVTLNPYVASAFDPEQLSQLLDALPYKNAEFSIKKGQRNMRVIIPRDEILQLRRNPAEKSAEKPSILEAIKLGAEKSHRQSEHKTEPKKSKGMEI